MKKPVNQQLSSAIRDKDSNRFIQLIEENPEFIVFDYLGGWLNYSASQGDETIVRYLVESGLDVNKKEKYDGISPLCSACQSGHFSIVKYLLDHGAEIDITASVRNPLFAAISGSVQANALWDAPTGEATQIIKLLLDRGIDSKVRYNTKTMKNMDAVAFAMMMGARDLARIIALWNEGGSETRAQSAMDEGARIAKANTKPIPSGEQVAPS